MRNFVALFLYSWIDRKSMIMIKRLNNGDTPNVWMKKLITWGQNYMMGSISYNSILA